MERQTILIYSGGRIYARLGRGEKTLAQGVRFELRSSEKLALIGETGSGKTMTALSIMDLMPENVAMEGGSIRFEGLDSSGPKGSRAALGRDIVYIPQSGHDCLNPSKRIKYHLYDGLKKLGIPRAVRRSRALEALRAAGFSSPEVIMEKYPFQLSGGMAQRATIAIAACATPRLLIADEPTNGLDQAAKEDFMALLDRVFPGAGKLIITHDIGVAALCDRTLVLCGGRMMETGPSDQVLRAPRHPYTRALIAALVENGMRQTPLLRPQAGPCPFYRRCPQAGDACLGEPQAWLDGDTEWWCAGL